VFRDFGLSVGLRTAGPSELTVKALQTYDGGRVVRENARARARALLVRTRGRGPRGVQLGLRVVVRALVNGIAEEGWVGAG